MYLIISALLLWSIVELIFWKTHGDPLSEDEIIMLSHKRTKKYLQRSFIFGHYNVGANKKFKSSMNATGKLYRIDERLQEFPSLAAALLKGKKHEWVLIATATEERVKYLWANKGPDNQSVAYLCDLDTIIKLCKDDDSCILMRFHNHPNGVIAASEQDLVSAKLSAEKVSTEGINWFDFVCGAGRFLLYYKNISPLFCPDCAKPETIRKENAQSKKGNYKLHREIGVLRYHIAKH